MMKKLYYVVTNGFDMLVSMDEDNYCRVLPSTNDFPDIVGLEKDEQLEKVMEFLNSVEDDSSWEDEGEIMDFDKWLGINEGLAEPPQIIAEVEKDL